MEIDLNMELTVDGRLTFVQADGGPEGAAMVLVHGAGMDHRVWGAVTPFLTDAGWRVLALDLPGHGASAGPVLGSVSDAANWVVRVLDGLGIERAALAGHSYGSLISLDVAARYPDRVTAISLLASAERMTVNPDLLKTAAERPGEAAAMIAGWCHGVSRKADPEGAQAWTDRLLALMGKTDPGALAADLGACDAYGSAAAAAAKVRCPVSVILGARDRMTPVDGGRALGAAFADATVSVLECGHTMMAELPGETARLMGTAQ